MIRIAKKIDRLEEQRRLLGGTAPSPTVAQSTISLDKVRADGGTQSRASLYQNVVDEYAAAIGDGVNFPPIVIFYDGTDHWLADGFHRYHANRKAGSTEIEADVRQGTRRDAILYSVGANESHGLRRTNEDKRRAALTLLNDPEWSQWSDREIGRQCAVSHEFVRKLRPVTVNVDSERAFTTKHGTIATMDTSAIGKPPVRVMDPHQAREHMAVARAIRAEVQTAKNRRVEREVILAEKIQALPGKRYGVIVADPEWRFEPYSRETGMDRAADNHYPTSGLDEIIARDVASIAAEDCVLFLWATAPMLPQALQTLTAWGFAYKTHAIWFKQRAGEGRGTGYWFLGEHELLLVGTRGDVVAPAMGTQFRSVFQAPVGAHSEKPDVALEIIESYFPTLPKIELNRRGPVRPGWDAWGNEAHVEAAA